LTLQKINSDFAMTEYKRVISPLLLAGLFTAFAFVCLIVYFRKGKVEKWVTRKMKLGATILAVAGITTGCPPVITCYVPVAENIFNFDKLDSIDYSVIADLPDDSIVTGKIYGRTYDRFAFEIITNDSQLIQKGDLLATDGLFDQSVEDFRIILDSKIDTGKYHLNILIPDPENEENSFMIYQNWLKIK
jgi:hypothetical protein